MVKYFFLFLILITACNSNNDEAAVVAKKDTPTFLPIPKIETKEIIDSTFLKYWTTFTHIVKDKNKKMFAAMAADSLDCGADNKNGLTALNKFMAINYEKLFDTFLVNKFAIKDKVQFYDVSFDAEYSPRFLVEQLKPGKTTTKEVAIEVSDAGDEPIEVSLRFIETKSGYKFYGYEK